MKKIEIKTINFNKISKVWEELDEEDGFPHKILNSSIEELKGWVQFIGTKLPIGIILDATFVAEIEEGSYVRFIFNTQDRIIKGSCFTCSHP